MAQTFHFSGYSDDTFGCNTVDHDNCANGKPIVFRIVAESGRVLVWGHYAPINTPAGGWVVGITNDEEGGENFEPAPIPSWPMRLEPGSTPYSPTLVIEAPDDATVALARKDPSHG